MFKDDEVRPAEVQLTYETVRKILVCLLLFCVADLIKAVLAKFVAGHFHSSLHFTKMQDALNKVPFPFTAYPSLSFILAATTLGKLIKVTGKVPLTAGVLPTCTLQCSTTR